MLKSNSSKPGYQTLEDSMLERIQRDEVGYINSKNDVRNKLCLGLTAVVAVIAITIVILFAIF